MECNLSGVQVSGVQVEAWLSRASLVWASLVWASLVWASLAWASLAWASLVGASLVGASLSDRRWLEAKRNDRSWLVAKEFNTEVEEGPFAAHRRQEDSSGRKKIRGSSGTPLRSLPTTTSGCRISTLLTPYGTRCCGSSGFSSASAPSTRRHLSMCRELSRRSVHSNWGCSSAIQSILLLHLSFSEGEQNSAAGN